MAMGLGSVCALARAANTISPAIGNDKLFFIWTSKMVPAFSIIRRHKLKHVLPRRYGFSGDDKPPSGLAVFVRRTQKKRIAEFYDFKASAFYFRLCQLGSQLVMFDLLVSRL